MLVYLKRVLELLLQGILSDLDICFIVLLPIIYLYDQIIKFCEDCHNWDCILSISDQEVGRSMCTYHFRRVSNWRTLVPMVVKGGTHPEWSKTWINCYASPTKASDETDQIAWSWSWTSLAFAFSSRKDSTSWSSFSPPASNPGESWNMKRGLLLKENGR